MLHEFRTVIRFFFFFFVFNIILSFHEKKQPYSNNKKLNFKFFLLDNAMSSPVVKQPLYNRFSLDRQCPMSTLEYHGPPSFNFRPSITTSKHDLHQSPVFKQNMYLTFSKPSQPVIEH
mgnify:FL=1